MRSSRITVGKVPFQKKFKRCHQKLPAMRAGAIVLLILLSLAIASPVMAANEDRYGYIKVDDVAIQLDNGTAAIHVNYTVDEGTRFIFFLFGKQDLRNKLLKILNYSDAQMKHIDLSSAEFTVKSASYSVGDGVFWYPSHEFNVAIPKLIVQSPQAIREFSNAKEFPAGMGYFATTPPPPLSGEPDNGAPEISEYRSSR